MSNLVEHKRQPRNPVERLQETVREFSAKLYSDDSAEAHNIELMVGEHIVMGLYEASIGLHELSQRVINFQNLYEKLAVESERQQWCRHKEMKIEIQGFNQLLSAYINIAKWKPPEPPPGFWKRLQMRLGLA